MLDSELRECLTFDDVMLTPAYSDVLPAQVDVRTRVTRGIELNIPLVSAAMDSVTEARAAITIARQGGIGIIHKNMSPRDQAAEVDRVKRAESGIITDPVTVNPEQSLREALAVMRDHDVSGVPVVEGYTPVGILTARDIRFEKNLDQPVSALMTTELVTVTSGVSNDAARQLLHKHRIEKLLVVENGRLVGLITIKDLLQAERNPSAVKDERSRLRVGAAIGPGPEGIERADLLVEAGADLVVIDTAHGHSRGVIEAVRSFKQRHPARAGHGRQRRDGRGHRGARSTPASTRVKVGIGPGSICTTRIVAGIGVPQITAIADCARVADRHDVPVIADGGVKYSGDVTKAIAAGASSVMIGSLFAGTDESPGELVLYQGRSYKVYRGMGSIGAMKRGSKDRYGQAATADEKLVPEGIEGRVPHRGSLRSVIDQLVGGLRSGMGYTGSPHHRRSPHERQVHPHHRRRAPREPRARRDHHRRSAELPRVAHSHRRRTRRFVEIEAIGEADACADRGDRAGTRRAAVDDVSGLAVRRRVDARHERHAAAHVHVEAQPAAEGESRAVGRAARIGRRGPHEIVAGARARAADALPRRAEAEADVEPEVVGPPRVGATAQPQSVERSRHVDGVRPGVRAIASQHGTLVGEPRGPKAARGQPHAGSKGHAAGLIAVQVEVAAATEAGTRAEARARARGWSPEGAARVSGRAACPSTRVGTPAAPAA